MIVGFRFYPAFDFFGTEALNGLQTSLATAIYEDARGRLYLAVDASRLLILQRNGNFYDKIKQIEGIGYAKDFYEEGRFLWLATTTSVLKINTNDLTVEVLNKMEDSPTKPITALFPMNKANWKTS